MINGWTLIAIMACLVAFGNWCFRPSNSISGGGGIQDITWTTDFSELVPSPIVDTFYWTASFLCSTGRWLLAISTGFGRSSPDNYELVVAVISRLPNIEKRNMIRETWKTLSLGTDQQHGFGSGSSDSIRSKVFFVMPEQLCPLDPTWRARDSGCEPWQVVVPPNANENTFVHPTRIAKSMVRPGLSYDGMGFRIKFPVSIRNLAIAKRGLTPYAVKGMSLSVELIDALRPQDVLASSNFTKVDLDEDHSDDGYIYKAVHQELNLPRGFEGYLRIKPILEPKNKSQVHSKEETWNSSYYSGIQFVRNTNLTTFLLLYLLIFWVRY